MNCKIITLPRFTFIQVLKASLVKYGSAALYKTRWFNVEDR